MTARCRCRSRIAREKRPCGVPCDVRRHIQAAGAAEWKRWTAEACLNPDEILDELEATRDAARRRQGARMIRDAFKDNDV